MKVLWAYNARTGEVFSYNTTLGRRKKKNFLAYGLSTRAEAEDRGHKTGVCLRCRAARYDIFSSAKCWVCKRPLKFAKVKEVAP